MRPATQVVFDGQSLNNIGAASYPFQTMVGRNLAWSNVAISGTAVDALATTAASRLNPVLQHTDKSVLVFVGGQSDLVLDDTASNLLNDMVLYAAAARAGGADKVIMATITPSTVYTGPQEAQRVAVNTLIRASAAFDAVLDLAVAPNLTDASNLTYYSDGLHWTVAGNTAAAAAATPVLNAVLATL